MKNIGFIGAFDKLDLMLYIAKLMTLLGKNVLIIDATKLEKSKYIVPVINPTKCYITRYDDIDIAVGFESYDEIERYVNSVESKRTAYDYALVDVEGPEHFSHFYNQDTSKVYFTTSFELYSIKKGLETISQIKQPVEITRILFSSDINEEDNYYLEYLSLGYKIKWNEKIMHFPYNTNDLEAMIDGQKSSLIKIKNLSSEYKESLEYLITDIIPDIDTNKLRKIMRNIEREG